VQSTRRDPLPCLTAASLGRWRGLRPRHLFGQSGVSSRVVGVHEASTTFRAGPGFAAHLSWSQGPRVALLGACSPCKCGSRELACHLQSARRRPQGGEADASVVASALARRGRSQPATATGVTVTCAHSPSASATSALKRCYGGRSIGLSPPWPARSC
jgi:hypothetical protein